MLTVVVIPTYGNHGLTHALIGDIVREADAYSLRIIVVDNHDPRNPHCDFLNAEGPYRVIHGETVFRSGSNVKWARSFNLAARFALTKWPALDSFVTLDNDTRLSPAFFEGLRATWVSTGAGLVCPLHNQDWSHQLADFHGPAADYLRAEKNERVPFADKTAMFIPRSTYERVGPLDAELAPNHGWAVDIDYAMRVRALGLDVRVTQQSYVEHMRAGTSALINARYFEEADSEMKIALAGRYGPDWVHRVWDSFPLPDTYDELMGIVI